MSFQGSARSKSALYACLDFDDMLPLIGEFGRFQIKLFLIMIPFLFFAAFVYLNQIFITLVPEHFWCSVPTLQHLQFDLELARELSIPKDEHGNYESCFMYDLNYTEIVELNITKADPNWPICKCREGYYYQYDSKSVPYKTISTEYDWVCDDEMLPTYGFVIFFCGSILGGIFYGWTADRIGRKPILISANFVGCIGGIVTALSKNFLAFAFSRFLVGMAYDSCYTMYYILLLEYVGPSYRTIVANMSIGLFYTPASCLLPWIAYAIGNWRSFSFYTSITLGLASLAEWFVPESARWLVSVGKVDEAIEILTKISKTNKRELPPRIFEKFRLCCQRFHAEEAHNRTYSLLHLRHYFHLLSTTLVLTIIWMIITLVYDGHVRAINTVGTNIFITFTLASLTELPADIFLILVLDRCGRRWCAFFQLLACGLLSIIAAYLTDKVSMAAVAIAGRFFANICYNIGLQYAAEVLPTVIRAQGLSFIHIMGYVASLLSPCIVYLGAVNPSMPFLILGILGVIGAFLSFFLPETLYYDLPQTMSDGNDFGNDQKFCYSPCFRKHHHNNADKKGGWYSSSSLRDYVSGPYRSHRFRRAGDSKRNSLSGSKLKLNSPKQVDEDEIIQSEEIHGLHKYQSK